MKFFANAIWSGFRKRHRWRFGSDGFSIYHLLTNRRPRDVPEAFWRSIKRLKALLWTTFLFSILCLVLSFRGLFASGLGATHSVDRFVFPIFLLISVFYGCSAAFGPRIARGRYRRFLIDHSWLVCLRCGYVLKGLPPRHQCPECDLRYDTTEMKKTWTSWIDRTITYFAEPSQDKQKKRGKDAAVMEE